MTSFNDTLIHLQANIISKLSCISDCSHAKHNRCPDNFYSLHGACYMTGLKSLSFEDSKVCIILSYYYFKSRYDFRDLRNYI